MWNEDMEEQLIGMLEERPAMFAVGEKDYSSRKARTECWHQISEKMNLSEKELRKKWDSLRTQYSRYKKLPPSGSSGAEKTQRQQWVLRRLQFLEPHTKRRGSTSNLTHKEPTAPTDTSTDASVDARLDGCSQEETEILEASDQPLPLAESTTMDMDTLDLDTSTTTSTSNGPPAKLSRSVSETHVLAHTIGAALEKLVAAVRQPPPEDFITAACKCIELKFRMVPPHLVARLENSVQNLIFNFFEEHNLEYNRRDSGLQP